MRVSLAATAIAAALLLPAATQAQTRVSVEPLACIPVKEHAAVTARVSGEPGGSTVRLYFRRLHEEVEDLYYVEMTASGGGDYWAVLPSPADEELDDQRLEDPDTEEQRRNEHAAWWLDKEMSDERDPNDDLNEEIIEERASVGKLQQRDWMRDMPLPDLETWIEDQEQEPAEYFATVVDANGREIARSTMRSVPVKDRDDCDVELDRRELGQAVNLVVGETAPWQQGRPVFHWLCDGIVSRIDAEGILRIDERCRACAFALNRLLVPVSAGTIGVLGVIITDEPEPASPTEPLIAAGP
jgi:hypothetical protein